MQASNYLLRNRKRKGALSAVLATDVGETSVAQSETYESHLWQMRARSYLLRARGWKDSLSAVFTTDVGEGVRVMSPEERKFNEKAVKELVSFGVPGHVIARILKETYRLGQQSVMQSIDEVAGGYVGKRGPGE